MNGYQTSYLDDMNGQDVIDLITAYYRNNSTKILGANIKLFLNQNSGYHYLVDEDFNAAMEYNYELFDFLICPNCGHESISLTFIEKDSNDCCIEYFNNLNLQE